MKETVDALVAELGTALKSIHDAALTLGKDVVDLDAENTRLRFEIERLEKELAEKSEPEVITKVVTQPTIPPVLTKSKSIKSFKTETLLRELERRGFAVHFLV